MRTLKNLSAAQVKRATALALDYVESGFGLDPAQVYTTPSCRAELTGGGYIAAQIWVLLTPAESKAIRKDK